MLCLLAGRGGAWYTVFKHMRHWACPKRSMKKYFSFHAGLKVRCSMSTFLFLADEVASPHWPKCSLLVRTFTRCVISLMKPAFVCWGIAGWIAMLLPSRVAGRTLGLRGPDLARGPELPAHALGAGCNRYCHTYNTRDAFNACVAVSYVVYNGQ